MAQTSLINQRARVGGVRSRGFQPLEAASTVLIPVLACVAGAIHLAHTYLPMGGPAGGPPSGGAPPMGAGGPPPSAGGLMSLVMPHLSQAMVLNFVGFIGLAALFVLLARTRPVLRVGVDVLLVVLCVATLYAWNAMGRSNPLGLGTWALVDEAALICLAVADALLAARGRVRRVMAG